MSKYKKNIIANYTGSIISGLLGLISIPVYIYYLGMESFGLIGLYMTLQAVMVIFDMGLSPTLNREMAQFQSKKADSHKIRELLFSLEAIYFVICCLLISSISFLAPFISEYWLKTEELPSDIISSSLPIIIVAVCVRLFSTLYRSAITGLQEQIWLNTNNVIFALLRGPGIIIYFELINTISIISFFLYQSTIGALELVALSLKTRRILPGTQRKVRFSYHRIKEVFKFAYGTGASTALSVSLNQSDKIILSGIVPLKVFAYYTLASTLANTLYMLISPISTSALPRFTELISKNKFLELSESYRNSTQLSSLILIPIALVMCIFSENILILWTSSNVTSEQTKIILSLLVIGTMFHTTIYIPTMLQYAYGWATLMLRINFLMLVIAVPSLVIGIRHFGVIFAPISWIVINVIPVFIAIRIMHQKILPQEKASWYKYSLLYPLASTSIALLILCQLTPDPGNGGAITNFLTLGLASIVSFSTASLSIPLGRRIIHDLKLFIHSLIKKI